MLEADLAARLGTFRLEVALRSGEGVLALIGPSGAGKTFTLNCLSGLHRPFRGRVMLQGRTLFDAERGVHLPPRERRIGYVFQSYALFPHMTVAQNLSFGLAGWPHTEARKRVAELISILRLDGLGERRPSQLSGGEQQRVALGRALAPKPELLLLDEPFAALDPVTRSALAAELLDLQRTLRLPVVLVTHDVYEAYTVSDHMVVLDHGRVLQAGEKEQVFRRPASATVARLVGMRNLFTGRVTAADEHGLTVATPRFAVHAPAAAVRVGAEVQIGVRPEDVAFVRPGRPPHEDEVQLQGRIVSELDHSVVRTVFFKVGTEPSASAHEYDVEIVLSSHSYRALGLDRQREWTIGLRRSAVHVLAEVGDEAAAPR